MATAPQQTLNAFRPHERKGEPCCERCSEANASALRANRAAMQLDQTPDDRETEAKIAMYARDGAIGLPKTTKDVTDELRRYALASVCHRNFDGRSNPRQPDLDTSIAVGTGDRTVAFWMLDARATNLRVHQQPVAMTILRALQKVATGVVSRFSTSTTDSVVAA